MDGHNREELLNGPVIWHGLKDAEVGDELVGQALVEILEFFGNVFQALVAQDAREFPADFPEQDFPFGAVFQAQVTQVKERQ